MQRPYSYKDRNIVGANLEYMLKQEAKSSFRRTFEKVTFWSIAIPFGLLSWLGPFKAFYDLF